MRAFIAIPVVLLALGCHGPYRFLHGPCVPCEGAGKPPCVEAEPCPQVVKCPPPKVEVKAPGEIHVKAPAPKVVVTPPAAPPAAAPTAPPQMMPSAPMAAPMMPAAPQMSVVTATVASAPSARAIPAVGIDWIKIPFPIPRLFAVPTQPEFTIPITQANYTTVPAMPMQMMPMAMPACAPAMPQQAPCLPAPAAPQACPAPGAAPRAANPQSAPGQSAPGQPGSTREVDELTRKVEMLEKLLGGLDKRPAP